MIELDKETMASTADAATDDPRAVNEVLALLDSTWLDPKVHARPTHYNIATSVVCNIKCVFCPRQTFGPEIDSGFLKAEFFDPMVPHLEAALRTGLFGLGEPFLHKRFFEFARAAHARGTYTMTSSHGMSLSPEVVEKVLECGLNELCVSFDGATARTANFLRHGADFDTIVANVAHLLERRRALGRTFPRVHVSFTVSKYNVWEMCGIVRLVHRLGADQLAFSNLVLDHPEHAHVSAVGTKTFAFNLKRALALADRLGVKASYFPQIAFPFEEQPEPAIGAGQRWGCPEAWRALIVEKDGTLKPCCYLRTTFGKVTDGPLPELLNAPRAIEFRRTFTQGRYLNTCRGCGQFYRISDEETREILEAVSARIASGNFSAATRILLEEKLRYFEALFQQAQGGKHL
jgi:MoaA/NifB/PqqE/SkfB family radical SAM enzyme